METPFANVEQPAGQMRLSAPTLALGAVAVAATTMSVTMLTMGSSDGVAAPKFAPSAGRYAARTGVQVNSFGRGRGAAKKQRAPSFDIMDQEGILPPVGFLDPLGFAEKASPERLRWFREAELKHGRVAMLAATGFLVAENPDLKDAFFPGKGSELASNVFADHNLDNFWYTFVAGCGVLEVGFFEKFDDILSWKLSDDYAVGDLEWDPLGIKPDDPEEFAEKRTKELQNGRLAMLALAGFNAQELTDGKPIWPIHGLDSPASAADVDGHISKGLELVKEMGAMLAETAPVQH